MFLFKAPLVYMLVELLFVMFVPMKTYCQRYGRVLGNSIITLPPPTSLKKRQERKFVASGRPQTQNA